jgi:heat shock protein HslJ
MKRSLALATILALALTACADPGEEGSSDPTANAWVLEAGTLDGADIPVIADRPITLVFDTEAGTVSGTSACNQYFAAYTLSGSELTFDDAGSTMMACEPPEVMDAEAEYLQALTQVELFTIESGQLNLTGEAVDLLFVVDETATTTTS